MQIFSWFSFQNFPLAQFSPPHQVRFQHLMPNGHPCVVLHFLIFSQVRGQFSVADPGLPRGKDANLLFG